MKMNVRQPVRHTVAWQEKKYAAEHTYLRCQSVVTCFDFWEPKIEVYLWGRGRGFRITNPQSPLRPVLQ